MEAVTVQQQPPTATKPVKPASKATRKPRPAAVPPKPAKVPETLRECLAPLAAAAIETSTLAYHWGLSKHQLMRASSAMALAGNVVEACNKLLAHEATTENTAKATATQREVGVGGAAK